MNNKVYNYQILAENFIIEGDLFKAYRAFNKAYTFSTCDDERIDILFEMGDLLWQMDKTEEAKRVYKKINAISEEPGAYYALGLLEETAEDNYFSSISNLEKAIELDPTYEEAYYYLGLIWDKLGDREKSKELLFQSLSLDPLDYVVYSDLASMFEEEGAYKRAETYAKKSLEIYPMYDKALYNLGVIQQKRGALSEALKSYRKSIVSNPFEPANYLNMSAIYLAEGKLEMALEILTEGIDKDLNSVNLHYNRSCTFVRMGLEDLAKVDLKRAIEINSEALIWARRDQDLLKICKEL